MTKYLLVFLVGCAASPGPVELPEAGFVDPPDAATDAADAPDVTPLETVKRGRDDVERVWAGQ